MNDLSAFRGASGEVVRGFVRPSTLATCIPVMIAMLVLGALAGLVVEATGMPAWMAMAVSVATTAPVLGLFAMSARAGAFSCGFFEALIEHRGSIPGFVLRFSAIGMPFAMVAGLSAERLAKGSMMSPGGMTGALGWLGLLLVSAVIGPSLGLLVAVRADSVGEALSPELWGWVVFERRPDLPAYFASAIGGLALFWMLSLPAIAILAAVAAAMDPRLGLMLAGIAWIAPFTASPILLGRLAGAFAAGDYLDASDLGPQPARPRATTPPSPSGRGPSGVPASGPSGMPAGGPGGMPAEAGTAILSGGVPGTRAGVAASGKAGAPAPPSLAASAAVSTPPPLAGPAAAAGAVCVTAAGTSLERRTPVQLALKTLEERAETDLGGALKDCQALCEQEPRSAACHVTHARLLRRAGLDDEARETAARAVPLAMETGAASLAVELFLDMSEEANRIPLDGTTWLKLGRALGARSHGAAAHWCLRAAAATGADEPAVDKARLQLAVSSLEAGRVEESLKIYETFLAERADSPLADFAREGAALASRRLPQTTR